MQRPEVQEKLHKPKKRKNEKQNNWRIKIF
jgi:hypothetical protein